MLQPPQLSALSALLSNVEQLCAASRTAAAATGADAAAADAAGGDVAAGGILTILQSELGPLPSAPPPAGGGSSSSAATMAIDQEGGRLEKAYCAAMEEEVFDAVDLLGASHRHPMATSPPRHDHDTAK